MRGEAANISTTVAVVTVLVVVLTVALIVLAVMLRGRDFGIVAVVAAGLGAIAVWTFVRAPVAYELTGDTLTIELRFGSSITALTPMVDIEAISTDEAANTYELTFKSAMAALRSSSSWFSA